jgi:hypothetical protein
VPNKKTSRRFASEASELLRNPESTKPERSVAGSDLSQAGPQKKPKKKGKK